MLVAPEYSEKEKKLSRGGEQKHERMGDRGQEVSSALVMLRKDRN